MKKTQTKPLETQTDVIDSLLPTEQTVTVSSKPVTLKPPTVAAVRKLRKVQYALAPRDGTEPDMDSLADASLDLAMAAVQACIPGLDHERAFRLVLISGGEAGELVRTAMNLCGIGTGIQKALREGADDLPT